MTAKISIAYLHPGDPDWTAALDGAIYDTYDTPAYGHIDADRIGGEAIAILAEEGDLVLLMPLVLRSIDDEALAAGRADRPLLDAVSPYGYPGIVLNDAARSTRGFVDRCLPSVIEALKAIGVCSVFVRLNPLLNADFDELYSGVGLQTVGTTVSIDLRQSERSLWASMRRGHTNAINQAIRAGFETEIVKGPESFAAFAGVFAETIERQGEQRSYDCTSDQLRRMAELDQAYLAIARLDTVVAGAYLLFECNGLIQMHLGGTRSAYMRPSPSNLLIHRVALWGMGRGAMAVHLGGGLGGVDNDGLFRFKTGFSRSRHRYQTLRLVVDEHDYDDLVRRQARRLGTTPRALDDVGFFPAYRAGRPASAANQRERTPSDASPDGDDHITAKTRSSP